MSRASRRPMSRLSRLARASTAALAALGALWAPAAQAERHALIMWISRYPASTTTANLPGSEVDARQAAAMARRAGVPEANITLVKNEELSYDGMTAVIRALQRRVKPGDTVFIYYSGHGGQRAAVGQTTHKCSEGLVTYNRRLYLDADLEQDLSDLADKAAQVVMFNDSCFAGGASAKALSLISDQADAPDELQAKFVGLEPASSPGDAAGSTCGQATNLGGALAKAFGTKGRVLYVAAAADNQAAYSGPRGSLATLAWAQCLGTAAADTNGDGMIDGFELQRCAQPLVEQSGRKQTITITGDGRVPLARTARLAAARSLAE